MMMFSEFKPFLDRVARSALMEDLMLKKFLRLALILDGSSSTSQMDRISVSESMEFRFLTASSEGTDGHDGFGFNGAVLVVKTGNGLVNAVKGNGYICQTKTLLYIGLVAVHYYIFDGRIQLGNRP